MIIHGDALTELKKLDGGIAQTCVTSPPYWGLRDYGVDGQLGLEPTPEEYIAKLVEIFAEVKRVLRDDGTLWLVIGDSYAKAGKSGLGLHTETSTSGKPNPYATVKKVIPSGLKPKDLCMIPARVALALQADGWWLRSDIIWHKPNPMPESVADRPTSAHEHIFLAAKSQRYYYDAEAIKEDAVWDVDGEGTIKRAERQRDGLKSNPTEIKNGIRKVYPNGKHGEKQQSPKTINGFRNKRNVWTVATRPYSEAHFATYPPDLIEPCILAGSAEGDIVLDPFFGSGTTGEVAIKHRREFIGIELNPEYVQLAEKRLREVEVRMF